MTNNTHPPTPARRRMRELALAVATAAALQIGSAQAGAWLDPGDTALRHDLQLLVDAGLLAANTSTWPIPRAVLDDVDLDKLDNGTPAARAAWQRLRRQAPVETTSPRIRANTALGERERFRSFHATPRERAELTLLHGATRGAFDWRLSATAVHDPEDGRKLRFDGSHVTAHAGDWLLSAGALERWWGPGHDGSIILGTNARPVPGVSLQRAHHAPFETRWLSWAGPWDLSVFLGRTEKAATESRWVLFGARLTARPLPGLEVALVRTAQWGGDGRPQTLLSFYDLLRGASNRGDRSDDADEQAGNQFAGYEMRWTLPRQLPAAIYAQYIGIDEWKYLPHQWIGLAGAETWGQAWEGRLSYRLHVEYADTLVDFYRRGTTRSNPKRGQPYIHSQYPRGYRYHDRPLGHPIDSDSRQLTAGWLLLHHDDSLRGRIWHAEINRTGRGTARIAPEPAEIIGADLTWERRWQAWSLQIGGGAWRERFFGSAERHWEPRGHVALTHSF